MVSKINHSSFSTLLPGCWATFRLGVGTLPLPAYFAVPLQSCDSTEGRIIITCPFLALVRFHPHRDGKHVSLHHRRRFHLLFGVVSWRCFRPCWPSLHGLRPDRLYVAEMSDIHMYWLQGDEAAGEAFFGANAETGVNENWQDVTINFP